MFFGLYLEDFMNRSVVYVFWGRPFPNLSSPILSIATLRFFDPNVPISVIDFTGGDWGRFPERLSFNVIKSAPKILESIDLHDTQDQYGHYRVNNLSRPFDILSFADSAQKTLVVYSDSDIFYLQNPFPLYMEDDGDFFCCKDNSGLFYFRGDNPNARRFMETWKRETIRAALDNEYRRELLFRAKRLGKNELFHDEIVCCSLDYKAYDGDMYNVRISKKNTPLPALPKCIHAMFVHWGRKKGILPLVLSETREAIMGSLGLDEIRLVTGGFVPSVVFDLKSVEKHTISDIKKAINCLL
jgi:hypothetical protein